MKTISITPSARKTAGIIDVHSHIITNLGSQAPMDKLQPWSIEQSLSLMDANGISASVLSLPDSASHAKGPAACQLARRINEHLAAFSYSYTETALRLPVDVSFPVRCEADNISLKNYVAYIRERITRERNTSGRNRSKSRKRSW
jgi:hypothetical protein